MMHFRHLLIIMLVLAGSTQAETPWSADPALVAKLSATRNQFNYDESKVPEYSLPDPLRDQFSETKIDNESQWPALREKTLNRFRSEMYGHRPSLKYKTTFKVISETNNAMDLGARGQLVTVTLKAGDETFEFPIYVYLPAKRSSESQKFPAVIHINNRGLGTFDEVSSTPDEFWPLKEILSRGYVACGFFTSDVDPDQADGFEKGIRGFFHRASQSPEAPGENAWKALSAWGFGASRALDYLLTLAEVDASKVGVIGHSRGGKAALWAAAEDTRFAVPCSNNSGCGGAALSRRVYGETVARITTSFPHWFCDRFATYAGNEPKLPFDQHQLFGLIAPRPVYATSAADDLWADPRGEYLSMVAATPVYNVLGKEGFSSETMPALNQPRIEGAMGYHIRPGAHGLSLYDWSKYLDFCDLQCQR